MITQDCIILAGGFGTRLQSVVSDKPKCMAEIAGKPFLEYLIQYLEQQGIKHIILSLGYKSDVIINWLKNRKCDIKISYTIEDTPLGTGGAIKKAFDYADQKSFVINGDTFFDIDLNKLSNTHQISGADITIALKEMHDFDRYGSVIVDSETQRILKFDEKQFCHKGFINGGTYLINKNLFTQEKYPEKFSFETEILEKQVVQLKIYGCIQNSYFIDIGIPSDYEKANIDFKNRN